MIDPKEIRLGNLIINCGIDYDAGGNKVRDREEDEIITVDIDTIKDCIAYSAHYDGIPLTPEWLERCRFAGSGQFAQGTVVVEGGGDVNIRVIEDEKCKYYIPFHKSVKIEYVHQLQNLYFTLTGEELQIKLHESTQPEI